MHISNTLFLLSAGLALATPTPTQDSLTSDRASRKYNQRGDSNSPGVHIRRAP